MEPSERGSSSFQELELWKQFKRGDSNAFSALMQSYSRVLFVYGSKYSDDDEFVKDCIQDLFLDLWQRRDTLGEAVVVKAYLMASLRRRIHRALEAKRWQSQTPVDVAQHFIVEFSIEDNWVQDETTRLLVHKVKDSIERLPKRQQEVIYLKFFQELDRDQIANVMNINQQSVSNLLQAAIKQLKLHWKTELFVILVALLTQLL